MTQTGSDKVIERKAAYLGLTPRRYESGEISQNGRVSRRRDGFYPRSGLYEAANAIFYRNLGGPRLRSWARAIAERTGPRESQGCAGAETGCDPACHVTHQHAPCGRRPWHSPRNQNDVDRLTQPNASSRDRKARDKIASVKCGQVRAHHSIHPTLNANMRRPKRRPRREPKSPGSASKRRKISS